MKHVLVVDDSATVRRMVIAALHSLPDTAFVEAASGLEAIERMAVESIDLIVLDINMPDMTGIDAIKFLRDHPTYARVPILVLTTRGDEDSQRRVMALGANCYLTKPFVPRALAEEVTRLLRAGDQK